MRSSAQTRFKVPGAYKTEESSSHTSLHSQGSLNVSPTRTHTTTFVLIGILSLSISFHVRNVEIRILNTMKFETFHDCDMFIKIKILNFKWNYDLICKAQHLKICELKFYN